MRDNDYWDDDYFLNHRDENNSNISLGSGITGIFSKLLFVVGIVLGILCPPVGAFFLLIAAWLGEQ